MQLEWRTVAAAIVSATLFSSGLLEAHLFGVSAAPPKLGSRLPRSARPTDKLIMIQSADIAEEFSFTAGGRMFFIGANSKHRVRHVEVRDPEFSTVEGVRVGDRVQDVLKTPGARWGQFPGCFAFVMLPSGWAAGFWPVQSDQAKPGPDKYVYLDLKSPADVPSTMRVGFIFKSIYLR